jgi:hypothetical protein
MASWTLGKVRNILVRHRPIDPARKHFTSKSHVACHFLLRAAATRMCRPVEAEENVAESRVVFLGYAVLTNDGTAHGFRYEYAHPFAVDRSVDCHAPRRELARIRTEERSYECKSRASADRNFDP